MASLHNLLSKDGFQPKKHTKKVKFRDDSITLPIYICHDRRSFDSSRLRSDKSCSSVISSERTNAKSVAERARLDSRDEPAIDDVAIKAMVAILSGYVGNYFKDSSFRVHLREKCRACFDRRKKKKGLDSEAFAFMEMGIQSVERLVENSEMSLESLQKCIKILNIVATSENGAVSSNSSSSSSRRKTASYLSSCANLYLSVVYKIGRNDKISARHLLQVFCDSPFVARTHLLPELWDHFFLPHLLHLKIWYNKEVDYLANEGEDRERKIKGLNRLYREQMDMGTIQFALYYKEWLKAGAQAPTIPTVPLPAPSKSTRSRRKSAESSTSHHSSSSKLLYKAVFGTNMKRQSLDFDDRNGASRNVWDFDAEEDVKHCNYVEMKKSVSHRRSSSQSYEVQKAEIFPDSQKSDSFRFLGCRTEPAESLTQRSHISNNEIIKFETDNIRFQLNDIDRAIATICSSGSLTDCEAAIRAVSKAWLDAHEGAHLESSLSRASVIQGILEVLYVSNDDEILELAVSILAEIAAKSEGNRHCVLASDPQLAVSMRLLRSSSLFLKAAVLLYLVKPKAKQMVSMEWIPLVLRVLEFGDQLQILFSVRCSPYEAAYYFLEQLVTGFDEDKNLENAKQIISLGGLGLLVRRMDAGDGYEKSRAACLLLHCIHADGSCRHYMVKNLNKDAILALMVLENQANSQGGYAVALLSELLCISSRSKRIEFLNGLKKGWNCLNTMQILLLRLQRARAEERPIIAVILLNLDLLMSDECECSVYREEAVDAMIEALECLVFDEKIQQQAARALFILGGHFSYTGHQQPHKWLLTKAGFQQQNFTTMSEDEKMNENWQRKAALVLLTSGNKRLLTALSNSMANTIPSLARASLITICWICSYLHTLQNTDIRAAACSILVPHLLECLVDNGNHLEEKILASFSLHSLTNGTDYFSKQMRIENGVLGCLQKLSRETWTAKELISLIATS